MLANIGILFLLFLLNGFFAMAELAIVSARRARLRQLQESHPSGAKLALQLAEDPTSFLSIIQIGVTLNSVLAGAFGGTTLAKHLADYLNRFAAVAPYSEPLALLLTVAGVTYLNLVIGELLPKRVGLAYAEIIAVRVAGFMRFLAVAAAPVVWILRLSTDFLLWLFRLNNPGTAPVTEEEVKDLIAEGTESGVFKPAEKEMLEGVMRLADRTVRTIMTPRVDMAWLGIDDSPEEHTQLMQSTGYSRFPVAKGDLEEILGIIHAKDLLNAALQGRDIELGVLMRPPLIVPDSTPVLRLVDEFKNSGQHLAIVIDEYGSVEGLVTATDILETITGELPEPGQISDTKPVQRENGSWLIDGMMPLDEVETLVGLKNMRGGGDFHTIAGFVIDKLGRLPTTGDHFHWNEARFEVVDMDGRRIDKVLINPPERDEEDENEEV
ncbi:MAG: HlyC/CorC family transporter [Alphaproteobacteria bacterium]|nr:HlyC/CorC family transporter [Alphaproteobacteria bacterium]